MKTQWHLCVIESYPENEKKRLKPKNNLSVTQPDIFDYSWCIWLPIIPRVGDRIQFDGWQSQVSRVVLWADWSSRVGEHEGHKISAYISIRPDMMSKIYGIDNSIESIGNDATHKWEDYARRGLDLQYYAWELNHEEFAHPNHGSDKTDFYHWHSRIRPVMGDIIVVNEKRWRVISIELANANAPVDGQLTLEEVP